LVRDDVANGFEALFIIARRLLFSANIRSIEVWNWTNGCATLKAVAAMRPSCSLAIRRASKLWFALRQNARGSE